jgi:peptidyl-prolyl cis-trans isomerase A (cyclophilin A)
MLIIKGMRRGSIALLMAGLAATVTATGVSAQSPVTPPANKPIIAIETEAGTIRVELDPQHAPATVANFLRYVNEHFFDGTAFYRAVTLDNQPTNPIKIEVIQGGANDSKQTYPAIALERTSRTGIKHTDGTISMARNGPDTATSEFFICIGDQPALDEGGLRNPDGQGFAAFGHVVSGMDVVRRVQHAPVQGQMLTPPVIITRMSRVQ